MTKNKIAYALVAAVFVVSMASVSLATAETAETKDTKHFKVASLAGQWGMANMLPDFTGSVNVGDNLLANAKIGLAEAVAIAENEAKGTATNGNLGIQNDYLVYTVSVMSENQLKSVIVDAGDGKVLYVSDGIPTDVSSILLGGHGLGFFHRAIAEPVPIPMDENLTFEEQK